MNPPPSGGQPVSMDMALLVRLTERVDQLNDSIQDLAQSIAIRPTQEALDHQRRRTRRKVGAVAVVVAVLIGWLYYQNDKVQRSCEDRNANAEKFRAVLTLILSPDPERVRPGGGANGKPTKHDIATSKALKDYTESLKKINC